MRTTRTRSSHPSLPLLTQVPTIPMGTTAEHARRSVLTTRCRWDTLTYVYVLDTERHLIGVISLKELLCTEGDQLIDTVMIRDPIVAHPTTDREHVAMTAIRHGIKTVPIVDEHRVFLGIVGTDDILRTLHEEHVEDFLQFAGVRRTRVITDVLRARAGTLVRLRLPWLIVGLIGSMIGTLIVRAFEDVLAQELVLAFFIPLIVYMSDALGTQTQTLAIRTRAIADGDTLRRALPRELAVTTIMSAACAVLLGAFALVAFHSGTIAWTVALALFLTMCTASVLALVVTTLLERSGRDPAFGGGPLATVIQDVMSLGIYFLVATVILFR